MKELFNYLLLCGQELVLIVMVMLSVAFFSLLERKVLGLLHFRKGPNKIIFNGFLQPFADVIKLMTKDDCPLLWSNKILFFFSPAYMCFLTLIVWLSFPFVWGSVNNPLSIIFVMIIFGLTVYGIILTGWSSNSVFASLGSVRALIQSISYEVVMNFMFLCVVILTSSYCIEQIYDLKLTKLAVLSPFLLLITIISVLAELSRTPFDLSEGESELVSGYSVEYGGSGYTLIFLSENIMLFFCSFMLTYIFFNNLSFIDGYVVLMIMINFLVMIRGILPRIRYDILMNLCWMILLPFIMYLFNLHVVMSYFANTMISSFSLYCPSTPYLQYGSII